MASIGSLVVDMKVDTGTFETDLGRAGKAAEKHARKMQREFEAMGKKVALAAVAAATAITTMALKAIEAGDNLAKAATKSGIAIKAFSELAYAAQLSDVDLNSLSTALKKMQVALSNAGSGSKEVIATLRALGLSLSDISSLAPDKQFELLADRISKLKDPADRTRAAVELFGKAGGDLLPLFESGAAGIRALRTEAETLGKTLDEKGVKAIQEADNAIKRMKAASEGLAQTLAIKLAPAIANIADQLRIAFGGGTESDTLKRLKGIRESVLAGVGGDLSRFPSGGNELKYLKDLDAQITELERKARLRAAPVTHNRGATLTDTNTPGFAGVEAAIQAEKELAAQSKELAKNFSAMYAEITKETQRLSETSADEFGKLLEANMEAIHKQEETQKEHLKFIKDYYAELDAETRTAAEKQTAALEEFQQKVDILVANGTLSPEQAQKRLDEFKKTFDTMSVYAEQAARNIQDAVANFLFKPFDEGLKGMLKGFIDIIRRMVAEAAAAKLFSSKSSGGFGLGDIIAGSIGAIFGAGKSHGGYGGPPGLASGTNYVPKDNFPALLHKGEAVVPAAYNPSAGGIGGGITINNNVDARGATADAIAALPEVLRRNNDSLEAKIIDGLRRGKYSLG